MTSSWFSKEHCQAGEHQFKYVHKSDGNYLVCERCGEVKFDND